MNKYKIGYVDGEIGFRSFFHQALKDEFEVKLFDITEDTPVNWLVEEIFTSNLDVLVFDFQLDDVVDFNANQLIKVIQERNLYYPYIVLAAHVEDALDKLENVHLVNAKDQMEYPDKLELFKQKLKKIASVYKDKVDGSFTELKKLEDKRISFGLTPIEEDRYVDLNHFVDNTIGAKNS